MARYLRMYVGENSISYLPDGSGKPGVYIAEDQLTEVNNYFELEIIGVGSSGEIAIGLVHKFYPCDALPGWRNNSVGYHADNGQLYDECDTGVPFGVKCGLGDIMGCGIKFEHVEDLGGSTQAVTVFFSRNGAEVGTVSTIMPMKGLYPAVGMHHSGEAVRLNLHPNRETNHRSMARYQRMRIEGNILRFVQDVSGKHGVYIAEDQLTEENNYFELEIIGVGSRKEIGIGIVHKLYPLDAMPGWRKHSVGYHADNGQLYDARGIGIPFGDKCGLGDIMGCGIKFEQVGDLGGSTPTVKVFFSRNGVKFGMVSTNTPLNGLYPAVGMASNGDAVRLNLRPNRVENVMDHPNRRDINTTSSQCNICCDEVSDHALVPCGHQGFCRKCANVIFNGRKSCPICRVHIERVLKLF